MSRFRLTLLSVIGACSVSPLPPQASARYQGATVHIQVVDTATGLGVPLAIVVLKHTRFGGVGSRSGEVWLFGVPPGSYEVVLPNRCPFERREPFSITVGGDSAQDFKVAMSKHADCVWPNVVA